MPDTRLHLIGGFDLTVDGSSVPLQPASQRLLAFVALTQRGVDRCFAAFQLWPDHAETRARANLRSALWRLQRLPVEVVERTKTRLRLSEAVWLDFRDGLDELASSTSAADVTRPFDSFMSDLLPDWYDDWLVVERERFRQLRLDVLEQHAAAALVDGAPPSAIQLALSAIAIDPLRESSHRILIEAQLAEGNTCDARRTLNGYVDRLQRELGLHPSATLTALV